ncbi:GRAM domain-containing protein / ABA-responsive protein-related protein [Artemisia annua]|uniref:GRAM domain-containing protein / ABA-responsive protein-related protein n=1 Tax=Artemisia annua TaxID=35608 RepID=A0A2U1N8F8_ARTAN|nr:GRAM domain-containing protein / ABA-responsive protein-related protein [Artemisia annua]
MDTRLSNTVMGIPITSTRGLILSKPYQPHYSLSTTKSSDMHLIKSHEGKSLLEIVKHKLSYGAKILPLGREGKIFRKNFSTTDREKLVHASRCSLYTTAGAIEGILFMSTERVGFCSDRSLKTYSATGELLKFQYKVSIPLRKIKGVGESVNVKNPSNKYMELATMDDFSFWLLGFPNYKKTLRYLHQTISSACSTF